MSARVFAAEGRWLFSPSIDLLVFAGSASLAWVLVALGAALGLLESDLPTLGWLLCVVGIDVAHVWATGFRVYFDGPELRARPLLYLGLPLLAYLLGLGAHAISARAFWRMLAYVAAFHFIRQQAGFMALYARRGPRDGLDALLDRGAIYASMLYPLAHWHAMPPQRFSWFMPGDFATQLSSTLLPPLGGLTVALLAGFAVRQVVLARRGAWVPGKSVLVLATFASWYGGIVLFDSDYVFTVTNVLLHGVPYLVLTYRYARVGGGASLSRRIALWGGAPFVGVCVALAVGEELLWDGLVWHERPELFGQHAELSPRALVLVVPLLAVPQLTHYLLDGFVWRVRSENPVLRRELE